MGCLFFLYINLILKVSFNNIFLDELLTNTSNLPSSTTHDLEMAQ